MGPLTALNHWVDTTTEMVEYINGRLRGWGDEVMFCGRRFKWLILSPLFVMPQQTRECFCWTILEDGPGSELPSLAGLSVYLLSGSCSL
jgi:hypothetical protein